MIYFDCVNKTLLFIANSGQTIPRNNPTKSSTNFTELLSLKPYHKTDIISC